MDTKKRASTGQPSRTKSLKPIKIYYQRSGVPDHHAFFAECKTARTQNAIIAAVENRPATVREIAQQLGRGSQSIFRAVKLLVADGVLQKSPDGLVSLAPLEVAHATQKH